MISQRSLRDSVLPHDNLGFNSSYNSEDEKFTLQFDSFLVEHIDAVEIKIILFDETDTVKAYHYVSLKHLYYASKKGKDIWLCMGINDKDKAKFPLLHLRVSTYNADKTKQIIPQLTKAEPRLYDRDLVQPW